MMTNPCHRSAVISGTLRDTSKPPDASTWIWVCENRVADSNGSYPTSWGDPGGNSVRRPGKMSDTSVPWSTQSVYPLAATANAAPGCATSNTLDGVAEPSSAATTRVVAAQALQMTTAMAALETNRSRRCSYIGPPSPGSRDHTGMVKALQRGSRASAVQPSPVSRPMRSASARSFSVTPPASCVLSLIPTRL